MGEDCTVFKVAMSSPGGKRPEGRSADNVSSDEGYLEVVAYRIRRQGLVTAVKGSQARSKHISKFLK